MRPGHHWWIISKGYDTDSNSSNIGASYQLPDWRHDYGVQIELEKYVYYIGKRIYPPIIYKGQVITVHELASILGRSVGLVKMHYVAGATGYKKVRWDLDMDGFVKLCEQFELDQEAKLKAKEDLRESRRLAAKESFARLKAERRAKWHKKTVEDNEGVEIIPRVKTEGFPMLFMDGQKTTTKEIRQALDIAFTRIKRLYMASNFRYKGHLIEIRYRSKEETKALELKRAREKMARQYEKIKANRSRISPPALVRKEAPKVEKVKRTRRSKEVSKEIDRERKKAQYNNLTAEQKATYYDRKMDARSRIEAKAFGVVYYPDGYTGHTLYMDDTPVDRATVLRSVKSLSYRVLLRMVRVGRICVDGHYFHLGEKVPVKLTPRIVGGGSSKGVKLWKLKVGDEVIKTARDKDILEKLMLSLI